MIKIKKIKNNQKGTIILLTFLILVSVLTIGLGVSNLVLVNLKMGGTQARATKAYFAAEAGAEQILWEIRKNGVIPGPTGWDCSSGAYRNFCFDSVIKNIKSCDNPCAPDIDYNTLSNQSKFSIQYMFENTNPTAPSSPTSTIQCLGSYGETNRTVELTY